MASELERQYSKERQRIQRFIRSAERRGYVFPKNSLPSKPKRITPASVERLKKITPAKLYEKAEYIVAETGEVVSGRKGRILERQRASRKGARTRERNKREKESLERYKQRRREELEDEEDYENWVKMRRELDDMERQQFDDQDYADEVSEGEATYQWILKRIEEEEHTVKRAAGKLRQLLDDEINKYGKDTVMRSIAQVDDEIRAEVEGELYYRNTVQDTEVHLFNIRKLISGEAPTMKEAKEANEFAEVSEEMDDMIREVLELE